MSTLARLYNAFIAMGCGCFSVYYMVAYRDAGLTILMIALVNVVFDVSTTLAELPTSVLFDRWSREKTLMVGTAFRLSGFLMLLVWPASFPVVCAANLATGVGAAVESGATSALYIECSKERDPSLTMRTLMSQLYLITGASTIAGGLAGALLFLVAPNLIWLGAFVCYTAALPPLVLLLAGRHDGRKDHAEETTPDGPAESSLEGRRGILASVSELFRRPEVWHLVLFNLGTFRAAVLAVAAGRRAIGCLVAVCGITAHERGADHRIPYRRLASTRHRRGHRRHGDCGFGRRPCVPSFPTGPNRGVLPVLLRTDVRRRHRFRAAA
mgnify:CR=1 FL=1